MLVCEWMIVSESDRKIYVSFVFFVFFFQKLNFHSQTIRWKKFWSVQDEKHPRFLKFSARLNSSNFPTNRFSKTWKYFLLWFTFATRHHKILQKVFDYCTFAQWKNAEVAKERVRHQQTASTHLHVICFQRLEKISHNSHSLDVCDLKN